MDARTKGVWLNVAEKPSVAREAAAILSKGHARSTPSLSRFNPNFEFTMGHTQMIFTSVAGHLIEDDFPPQAKNWSSFPLLQLFTIPVVHHVKDEFVPLKKNLEALAKRATHVILWLDCDREGENIAFEVLQVVRGANRRIEALRAHFSALNERDLFRAVASLQAPNQALSDSVDARREMDLRVGAVFTRWQTNKFRDRFNGMPRVVSFGPCQFPTVGFVVQRHWLRNAFVPEDFFYAQLSHGAVVFSWHYGNVYDAAVAAAFFEEMLDDVARASPDVAEAVVMSVQQQPTYRYPPAPLSTVELQKLASQHLRMSAEACMATAEALYQQGYLSYPRTETDEFVTDSFTDDELIHLAAIQLDNPLVGDFSRGIVHQRQEKFRRPRSGGHNDRAHPPIHPVKLLVVEGPSGADPAQKLYLLVVRHFLACMSPAAVAATTQVDAAFGDVLFHTRGKTVVSLGWLDVYPYERWTSSGTMPNYSVGERFVPTEVALRTGRTAPPECLTEAQLIAKMDHEGIGTDATIATHIKTVLEREYICRDGNQLKPTPLGLALTSAYVAAGMSELIRPSLRAQMELAMADIARGAAAKQAVLDAAVEMYRDMFKRLHSRVHIVESVLAQYLAVDSSTTSSTGGGGVDSGSTARVTGLTGGADRGAMISTNPLVVLQSAFSHCGRCGQRMELVQQEQPPPDGAGRGHAGNSAATVRVLGYLRCLRCTPHLLLRVPLLPTVQLSEHPTVRCPICSFGVINVTNTAEAHRSYTICPWCFSHPPQQYSVSALEDLEDATGGSGIGGGAFRCFQCTNTACSLAKGMEQIAIVPCPSCRSEALRLRSSINGRYLSCRNSSCSFVVFLPSADAVSPATTESPCSLCGGVKLFFRFSSHNCIPGMDPEEIVCVACDVRLKEYLTVRGKPAPPPHASATSSAAPGSGRGGRGGSYTMPTVAPTARGGRGRGATRGGRGGRGGGGASTAAAASSDGGGPQCECGVAAKRLTSRQQTSAGRGFWTCGNNKSCKFFKWVEE